MRTTDVALSADMNDRDSGLVLYLHGELEAFIDKEFDEYVVWRNNNSLISKDTSSVSECVTVCGTFDNTKVSTGCLKSHISTESSTNSNSGSNNEISSGACEKYHNGENCLCSFLMEEIKFLRSKINFKNKIIKGLFTSKSMLHNEHFFSHNSEQIKNFNKNYQKTDNSLEILQGHDDKPSNNYDIYKMIEKRNYSFNQLNLDEDLPARNMLSTLPPKQKRYKNM